MVKNKIILFDLDDTLFDSTFIRKKIWDNQSEIILKYLNINLSKEKILQLIGNSYYEANKNENLMEKVLINKLEDKIQNKIQKEIIDELNKVKNQIYSSIIPYEKVIETVQWLTNEGFELGIASAGLLEHQLMKIKYLNLNKYFKANLIFVSEELNGTLKKDVLFFRKIKDKVKYDPTNTQIYMVGDKPSQDIVSPIIAGYDKCFLLMNYHYEKEKNILNQIDRSKYITIKNISDIIGYFYDEL